MGKKISVDSSTLINKVYELIEAKKIFDLSYSKLEILIQPTSYVHSVIKFFGGIIKVLIHDTSMKIPIFKLTYNHLGQAPNRFKMAQISARSVLHVMGDK